MSIKNTVSSSYDTETWLAF